MSLLPGIDSFHRFIEWTILSAGPNSSTEYILVAPTQSKVALTMSEVALKMSEVAPALSQVAPTMFQLHQRCAKLH